MLDLVYIVTLSLLITHQIDAAYWREWEMFLVPGGVQFFDIFNLAIVPVLLVGFKSVLLKKKSGYYYSCFLSSLGLLTFLIPTRFYLNGYHQFTVPVSMAVIILCAVIAVIQLVITSEQREIFQ
jgi:hypothetical protein